MKRILVVDDEEGIRQLYQEELEEEGYEVELAERGEEALEKIRLTVEPTLRDQGIVRRNRTRYWIQKYLRQRLGERYPALVLDTMRSNYRVLLKDFLMVTELRREDGLGLSNGQNIMVRVKVSDPWLDKLTLEYAGLQDDSS